MDAKETHGTVLAKFAPPETQFAEGCEYGFYFATDASKRNLNNKEEKTGGSQ